PFSSACFTASSVTSSFFETLSWVHSQTFPAISNAPKGERLSGKLLTANTLPPFSFELAASLFHSLPHGYLYPLLPRAASSHSASVGRRTGKPSFFSIHLQKATASCQVTLVTGKFPVPLGNSLSFQPGGAVCLVSLINS